MALPESNLKFAVLYFYYERPKLARRTIASIAASEYKNYEVLFIDDSEDPTEGQKIVAEAGLESYKYYHTKDTLAAKEARGASMFGAIANQAILESDSDVVVVQCDDDSLPPWALQGFNAFYSRHPEVMYSYCDVIIYDPSVEDWADVLNRRNPEHFLNVNHHPHCGGNSKDSSQQSFRASCFKEGGARWKSPLSACLDYHLWIELYQLYGPAVFNGVVGAGKAFWKNQLGSRGNTYGATE